MINIFLFSVIILLIILIAFSLYIINKTVKNKDDYYFPKVNNVFYDGLKLTQPAITTSSVITTPSNEKVNCNEHVVKCEVDNDCISSCLLLKFEKNIFSSTTCSKNNICVYRYKDEKNNPACLNGGEPVISYFMRGINVFGCICSENYMGRFCDIENLLKPAQHKTFSLNS